METIIFFGLRVGLVWLELNLRIYCGHQKIVIVELIPSGDKYFCLVFPVDKRENSAFAI